MTKGGYNGTRDRRGDPCPVCDSLYDRYIPADDDCDTSDMDVQRLCSVVNFGAYGSGVYVHLEVDETPSNKRSRFRAPDG